MKSKIFISTIPFASSNKSPLELLEKHNIDYEINDLGRKITENELFNKIKDFDALIAGTEPITKRVLNNAPKLKVISRVGVGVDNIDIEYASKKDISIRTSSEGPVTAVAEYTLGLILSMLRHIHVANHSMKQGVWKKEIGHDLFNSVVGVVGAGNIGSKVIQLLSAFMPKKIIYYDPFIKKEIPNASKVDLKELLTQSDVVTLHLPLSKSTNAMISLPEIKCMKKNAILVNTARGGIIKEEDLYVALKERLIAGSAIDVFENEPYKGKLLELENCLISPHMAPMTKNARESMELDAVKQALEFISCQ